MPYRVDIAQPPPDTLDRLIYLGALDAEIVNEGIAAILPDGVRPETLALSLGTDRIVVSPVEGWDDESVWLLRLRPLRIGSIRTVHSRDSDADGALLLPASAAFGSGYHPTTALCIEALEETFATDLPDSILDVGTGSGVLALAALKLGVPRAVGLDIDPEALQVAMDHARLNRLDDRLQLVEGAPDDVDGVWPLVVANVLAAPLIEMAPALVKRLGRGARLILSGIPESLEYEVRRTYERLGLRHLRTESRGGWTVQVLQATW